MHLKLQIQTPDGLLKKYNEGVLATLDKQTPLQRNIFVIRPLCSWLSEDVKSAWCARRVVERRWRKNRIVISRQLLNSARNRLNDLVENVKSFYLQKLTADSQDRRQSGYLNITLELIC